jgi:hypothetical protein
LPSLGLSFDLSPDFFGPGDEIGVGLGGLDPRFDGVPYFIGNGAALKLRDERQLRVQLFIDADAECFEALLFSVW